MSNGKDNEMWQRIEDAFTPNSDELKRTERELAKVRIEQDERLQETASVVAPVKTRRSWGKVTTLAAATLVVAAVAWRGSKMSHPEPQPTRTTFSQSFLEAEARAMSSGSSFEEWLDGLDYMTDGHAFAVLVLAHTGLEDNATGRAATAALQRFSEDSIEVRLTESRSFEVFSLEALDHPDPSTRLLAIEQLEAFLPEAERVLVNCDASTAERAKKKRIRLKQLAKRRRKAGEGTLKTYIPPRDGRNHMRPAKQTAIPIPEEFRKPKGNR